MIARETDRPWEAVGENGKDASLPPRGKVVLQHTAISPV